MKTLACLLGVAALAVFSGNTQASDVADDPGLEELLKAEVTSVSRKSQTLSDVAAAAFVISAEDIRRSGATAFPDVLRMVPGIQVAQIDRGRYAVSARGDHGRSANKLQVLIDGRSIYHPIFSGVLWEQNPIPLEDIERIGVIRGPGASCYPCMPVIVRLAGRMGPR
jgi:iron complex outermembrane receptor protein